MHGDATKETTSTTVSDIAPIPAAVSREPWYQRLKDRLWGYDFFISYHWASGGTYAVSLAARLREKGYDVFLDRAEYAMGDDWQRIGQAALHNTQRLVLIATREAVFESKPVQREVEIFTGRSEHVIPIVFGARFTEADRDQSPTLSQIPDSQLFIDEAPESLRMGPSAGVVEQLTRTDRVLRRRTLRTRIVTIAIAILSAALIAVGISQWRTFRALQSEQRERRLATSREYTAIAQALRTDRPDTSLLMALHARRLFDGTDQEVPFHVQSALFNSSETVRGYGLGREDGTVQVARIDGERLYTAGVVSDLFRIRDVSTEAWDTLLEVPLPHVTTPSLSFLPRKFSFSGDHQWVAVLAQGLHEQLAFVNLVNHDTQVVAYPDIEPSKENSDLNSSSVPVFSMDSKSVWFVDRDCHLHCFRQRSNRWYHDHSVDLFPTSAENPQLRLVAHTFAGTRFFVYITNSDTHFEVRAVELGKMPSQPVVLLSGQTGGQPDAAPDHVAFAGRILYAWETSGGVPFKAWELSDESPTLEPVPIALPSDQKNRQNVQIIAISKSGGDVVGQSSNGDTFIHSITHGVTGELPRFARRVWFSDDGQNLFTLEENALSPETQSIVRIWPYTGGSKLADAKEVMTYDGSVFDVISGNDGRHFAINVFGKKWESWVLEIDADRNVVQRRLVPCHIRHSSPDLRCVSDGSRLWNSESAAFMLFPVKNRINRSQRSVVRRLQRNRVLYVDTADRCIVGELLANGETGETALLSQNVITASVSRDGAHAITVTQEQCTFWSLARNPPVATAKVPLREQETPFFVQLADSGRFALLATTPKDKPGEPSIRILVVDQQDPTKAKEIEALDDLLSLRFEWLRDDIAVISSASTPAPAGGQVDADKIVESTRLWSFRGPEPRKLQELDIGGRWLARSGDFICVLSTTAERRGDAKLGKVFEVSAQGLLVRPVPIVKDKGQGRVEDLSLSADGKWISIAGNSPAMFVRSKNTYRPIYLEVDNDRLDECFVDPSSRWAISFSHTNWRSWVALWHLGGEQPNSQKIRIQSAEGYNIAGGAMNVRFGERHVDFTDDEATIVIGDQIFRIPLSFEDWRSTAEKLVGRELSAKEIREHLNGRNIQPLRSDWKLPLSVERWEGTH